MSNANESKDFKEESRDAKSLVELLTRWGGVVTVLIIIASYFGWRTAQQYYSQFGVGWVATILPSSALLDWSYRPLGKMIVGAIFGYAWFVDKAWTHKGLRRADLTTSVIGLTLLLVGYLNLLPTTQSTNASIAHIGIDIYEIALGFYVLRTILVFPIKDLFHKFKSVGSGEAIVALYVGVISFLPFLAGYIEGTLAANPETSNLSIAQFDGAEWRVLAVMPDRFVLVKLVKNADSIVRVVPSDQVSVIVSKKN